MGRGKRGREEEGEEFGVNSVRNFISHHLTTIHATEAGSLSLSRQCNALCTGMPTAQRCISQ